MNKSMVLVLIFSLVTSFMSGCAKKEIPAEAEAGALPEGLYAKIQTSKGDIVCRLEFEKVPMTVCNFVGLTEGTIKTSSRNGQPFFDGLIFHRVEPNFVIQGGSPDGSPGGGPGYGIPNEIHPELRHSGPGVLAMAHSQIPNSNGSQFYITKSAQYTLDGGYSVFGQVVEGLDVVNAIQRGDTIVSVTILRIGEPANSFKTDQKTFNELVYLKRSMSKPSSLRM